MKLIIILLKFNLNIIYFFFKMFPTNPKKIVFISRQTDSISIDYKLLSEEIKKIDSTYKMFFLCNTVKASFLGIIKYYFITLKHLYHIATSRVCVIDSYCLAVSIPKHKRSLIVIQMWHAIMTIKKFGFQTLEKKYGRDATVAHLLNMHKNYDWVISGSEAMRSVFSETFNISPSKIRCCGTPRIDYLLRNENKNKDIVLNKYPELKNKKIILYVPTFRKDCEIQIQQIIKEIDFNTYQLIVKSHPVKEEKFNESRIMCCGEFTSLELLDVADFVITDYSAISIEAALLNKQVYFYTYDIEQYEQKNGLNIDLYSEMGEVCYKDFKKLYEAIKKEEYPYYLLEHFKNKYVTNKKGNSGFILANYIINGQWIE